MTAAGCAAGGRRLARDDRVGVDLGQAGHVGSPSSPIRSAPHDGQVGGRPDGSVAEHHGQISVARRRPSVMALRPSAESYRVGAAADRWPIRHGAADRITPIRSWPAAWS